MRMINADDLLMLIDDHDNMVLKNVNSSCLKDVYKMAHVHIKDLIKMMPTIERKTGKWIIEPHEVDGMFIHRCSECMNPVMITSNDRRVYNYCPFCGADMRGGNER